MIGGVEAFIVAPTRGGSRLKFTPTPASAPRSSSGCTRRAACPGADRGDLGRMLREIARAMAD
ncbi:hypothetical protein DB459_00775 [Bradyrhizobium sp. WD16]|nr:hypothetical protein DB459_00775 [Bradyrhizobium sp. WD16]